jgi:hypothetical protein
MKTSIKIILALLTLTWSVSISAQEISKKAMANINKQVKEMVEVMGLDKDQEAKVLEIKKKQYVERQALSGKFDKESPEFKEKVKVLNKASWKEIKDLCTKEQVKKWSEREKE